MRRMFRRNRRKAFARNIPPVLQEANMAFEKGEYGRAAELFERIARAADARGGARAPLFHLQAGRARVYAGQSDLGMSSLKRGLELLANHRQYSRLHQAGTKAVTELEKRGLENEAAEIKNFLAAILPKTFSAKPLAKRPVLPTHCPSCGAPLRPDEVEWLDEVTAECGYCGTPARSG